MPTSTMRAYICVTCGTQFTPREEPPADCPICQDERQYVGHDGQQWTTLEDLRRTHAAKIEEVEPGLVGVGIEPTFAIGQRGLIVENVLWDCIPRIAARVAELEFERLYGAWWHSLVDGDAKAKVLRSATRYMDALTRVDDGRAIPDR